MKSELPGDCQIQQFLISSRKKRKKMIEKRRDLRYNIVVQFIFKPNRFSGSEK